MSRKRPISASCGTRSEQPARPRPYQALPTKANTARPPADFPQRAALIAHEGAQKISRKTRRRGLIDFGCTLGCKHDKAHRTLGGLWLSDAIKLVERRGLEPRTLCLQSRSSAVYSRSSSSASAF